MSFVLGFSRLKSSPVMMLARFRDVGGETLLEDSSHNQDFHLFGMPQVYRTLSIMFKSLLFFRI